MSSSSRSVGPGNPPPPVTPSTSSTAAPRHGQTAATPSSSASHLPTATHLGMLSPETAQRMHHLVGNRRRASSSSATSICGPPKRPFDGAFDDEQGSIAGDSFMDNSTTRIAFLGYGSVYHSPDPATPSGTTYPRSAMGLSSPGRRSARLSASRTAGKRSRISTGSNASVTSTLSISTARDVAPLRAEIDSLREQLRKAESERFMMQSKYDRDLLELEQRLSEKDGLVDGLQKKVEEYKLQRNAVYDHLKSCQAQVTELSDQLVKAKENGFVLDTTLQTNTETSQARIRHLETQLRNQISTANRTEKMLQQALAQSDAEVKKLQEANLSLAKTNLDLTTQLNTAQSSLDTVTTRYVEERRKTLLAPRVEAQRKEAHDHLAYAKELEAENARLKLALQRMVVDEKRLASVEEERGSLAAKVQVLQRQVAQMAAAEAELKEQLQSAMAPGAGSETARSSTELDDLKRQLERLKATLRHRTELTESLQAQIDALKVQLAASASAANRAEELRFEELRAKKVAEAQVSSFKDEVEYFRRRVNELMAGIMANASEGAGDKAAAAAEVQRWEQAERELREKVAQAEKRADCLMYLMSEALGWHVQRNGDTFRMRSHFAQHDDWSIELGLVPHPTLDAVQIWQIVGYGSTEYEQYVAVPKLEWEQATQQAGPRLQFKIALAGFLADLATNHCRNPRLPHD